MPNKCYTELCEKLLVEGRYYNANYYATAIVASITQGVDWAAYIGGAPVDLPRKEAMVHVAREGDKLSEEDARYYFPNIKTSYRS